MSVRAEAGVLQLIPLFADCDKAHLQVLAFAAEKVEFAPGQYVFRDGERGNAAYLILQGTADVQIREGTGIRLAGQLEPGAFAGELSMIAGLPYTVSIFATSRLITAKISRELFMRVAREFPDFGARVQAALARKLDQSVGELKTVKTLFEQPLGASRRQIE